MGYVQPEKGIENFGRKMVDESGSRAVAALGGRRRTRELCLRILVGGANEWYY
jgi:hypothetical protein